MRILVIVNQHSGARLGMTPPELRRRLAATFAALQVEAEFAIVAGETIGETARQGLGRGFDAIVAGGGDGTVGAVAGVLADSGVALGILPLGTLNHFARDLGLPPDIDACARIIAAGRVRLVDAGEVNGRIFVNNSSLGIYPRMVVERDRGQRRGLGKWVAMALAALRVLRRLPLPRLRLSAAGWSGPRRTPLLFVGNNFYAINRFSLGHRPILDAGELCVYVVAPLGRLRLVGLACRALFGRLDHERDFALLRVRELTVGSQRRRLRVALDGEALVLAPPLRYRSRPGALRVVAP